MKCNYTQSSAFLQQIAGLLNRLIQPRKFAVYLDSQGLKRPARGVLRLVAVLSGDGLAHDLRQLKGGLDGILFTSATNLLRNSALNRSSP
jgi:hypothetical protein